MTNYIAINQEAEDKVQASLKKQRIFSDVDQFILLYNQGIINVNKDEIKDLADLIAESYSNVILQRRKFYVQSKEETYIKNALFVLENWAIVESLKRIAETLINEGFDTDTKLVFFEDKDKAGIVYLEGELNEDGSITENSFEKYEYAEKLNINANSLASNVFLQPLINDYDQEGLNNVAYINAFDLINLDDNFAIKINDLIESQINN